MLFFLKTLTFSLACIKVNVLLIAQVKVKMCSGLGCVYSKESEVYYNMKIFSVFFLLLLTIL